MRIDIPEIEKVLPHRPPFLLIDRIIELEPMKYAVGIKNISINEDGVGIYSEGTEIVASGGSITAINNAKAQGIFTDSDVLSYKNITLLGDKSVGIYNYGINQMYATNLGVKFNEFKTSQMKYRWGSCTPNNNIIFNWRIIKAPMYVLEYLVAHELVHLIEENHTPRFWNILSIQVPNYQKAKNWLKVNGHLLEVDF